MLAVMDKEFQDALAQLERPLIAPLETVVMATQKTGPSKIGERLEAAIRDFERAAELHDRAFWTAMSRLNGRLRSVEERVAKLERAHGSNA